MPLVALKRWKFAFILIGIVWFGTIAYIGFAGFLGSAVNVDELHQTIGLLAKSQQFIKKLKNNIKMLEERVVKLEAEKSLTEDVLKETGAKVMLTEVGKRNGYALDKSRSSKDIAAPKLEYEFARRRASKELREMWYFLSAEITKINKDVDGETKTRLTQMLDEFAEMQRALGNNMEKINTENKLSTWRQQEHGNLSRLVQRRLHRLQNPADCLTAKKLVCELNKGCGYGCQVHHLLYCFLVAYGAKRTLILDSRNWRYSPDKGWEGVFQPVSNKCTTVSGPVEDWSATSESSQNVLLPIVDGLYPKPKHLPLAVPADLADRLKLFHSFPFVWWIGQFAKYLFRYQPEVMKEINERKKRLGFGHPIVGVHVRRTDKINMEAAFHRIEEYMYWVDLYYKRLSKHVDKKRVYLASDDASILQDVQKKYPDYHFVSDNEISRSAGVYERYSDKSLHGIIFDIQMLSECDFIVCTFSSQVCRVAYEVMQHQSPDASDNFQSLDDVYYFGGQSSNNVQAIYPYKAKRRDEIDLKPGDLLKIAGNHWDGFSRATNIASRRQGGFPSYLVEKYVHVVDFPDYSDFDKNS